MICKNCGRETDDAIKFCPYCGAALVPDDETDTGSETRQPLRFDKQAAKSPDEYFFDPVQYGETEPFDPQKPGGRNAPMPQTRLRRRRSVSYHILSALAILASAANFFLPFMMWISYNYSIAGYSLSNGRLNLIDLIKRFAENDGIIPFITGYEVERDIAELIPDKLSQSYTLGRYASFALGGAVILSLILYLVYALLLLLRVRRSAGVGISAAVLNALAAGVFLIAVNVVNNELDKYDLRAYNLIVFDAGSAPYLVLWLSGCVIILSIVIAIVRKRKR